MENFKVEVDEDGIAVITFDVPGRSMNTITAGVMKELPEIVERIKSDAAIKGAVLQSGKATGFCAGADLGEMGSNAAAQSGSRHSSTFRTWLRWNRRWALTRCVTRKPSTH